jgi:hypothetical protein
MPARTTQKAIKLVLTRGFFVRSAPMLATLWKPFRNQEPFAKAPEF